MVSSFSTSRPPGLSSALALRSVALRFLVACTTLVARTMSAEPVAKPCAARSRSAFSTWKPTNGKRSAKRSLPPRRVQSVCSAVSAFAGMEATRAAYAEAIREQYLFYSYGDCMLIL